MNKFEGQKVTITINGLTDTFTNVSRRQALELFYSKYVDKDNLEQHRAFITAKPLVVVA